jgi:hypothetical protein
MEAACCLQRGHKGVHLGVPKRGGHWYSAVWTPAGMTEPIYSHDNKNKTRNVFHGTYQKKSYVRQHVLRVIQQNQNRVLDE